MLHYTVSPQPESHLWHITLSFEHNSDVPQTLKLANWVAGSYMIRDFARHIVRIQAACGGEAAELVQTAKNEWHTPPKRGRYQIRYTARACSYTCPSGGAKHAKCALKGCLKTGA